MEYYFTPKKNIDLEKEELVIDGFEFRHLTKVLRKKTGDIITITDGERNIYNCEIFKLEKERLFCKIKGSDFDLFEPEVKVSLYLSPLRNVSRFEFAIEKAVELGITSIQPVITEYTVNKNSLSKSRIERINKIIIGAIGQSQRCYLPEFSNTISLTGLIEKLEQEKNKFVMYESSGDNSEFRIDKKSKNISVLIGPEGGFSNEEINSLISANWHVKSLGERKLRAETAAVVSVFELIKKFKS
jgi:16S rRNA (uracil1498-N3)-methyltransferase